MPVSTHGHRCPVCSSTHPGGSGKKSWTRRLLKSTLPPEWGEVKTDCACASCSEAKDDALLRPATRRTTRGATP